MYQLQIRLITSNTLDNDEIMYFELLKQESGKMVIRPESENAN